jgi:hypothetical protein
MQERFRSVPPGFQKEGNVPSSCRNKLGGFWQLLSWVAEAGLKHLEMEEEGMLWVAGLRRLAAGTVWEE